MTPQALKSAILQLAIQGKLVPQRPEEGSAEDLYRQIQAEKLRLVKAGKIKKEKPLTEIAENEIPFEIPESWKWVRLGNILLMLVDGTHSRPHYTTSGIPFLSVKDVSGGKVSFSSCKFVSEQTYEELTARCKPEQGDILLTKVGTTGIPALVTNEQKFCLFVSVALLKFSHTFLDANFLISLINSPIVQLQAKKNTKGVGNKNWVLRDIANTLIPLPPLAEQKRIVSKIEELLPLIDRYEQAWTKLEDFTHRFPADMQKSLLQMAIQGQLVEQRPEEGTGEDLYRKLFATKGTKKDKKLPPIANDEIPFEIPKSWKWVRLATVTDKITDGSHNPPPNTGSGYPVISAKNIKNGLITFDNVDRFTDQAGFDKENPRTNINNGDIIMGIIGGSIGNVGVYTHNAPVIAQRSIAIMHSLIDTSYLVFVLKSPLIQGFLHSTAAGSAQGGVYLGTLMSLLVPLPPLAEQKRIVAKLEELLPLCEKLK